MFSRPLLCNNVDLSVITGAQALETVDLAQAPVQMLDLFDGTGAAWTHGWEMCVSIPDLAGAGTGPSVAPLLQTSPDGQTWFTVLSCGAITSAGMTFYEPTFTGHPAAPRFLWPLVRIGIQSITNSGGNTTTGHLTVRLRLG